MRSLRSRILVLVSAVVIPLTLVALWLNQSVKDGSFIIVAMAFMALSVAVLVTRRITHSLEELADATRAVAAGDLDRRVSERSASESGRVGRAFNAMTASLRETLRRLSQREALAAVGQFAASLAHEVRNPLTSLRIDLQRVEEQLPTDSPLQSHVGRALRKVDLLDQTVSGALRIARSGSVTLSVVDLNGPLQRAVEVAAPAFERIGTVIDQVGIGGRSFRVRGDDAALEQLFLNLLLNAAQALGADGRAGVTMAAEDGKVRVDIWDSGVGMTPDQLEKVFDPFFSTKSDGTGLGLAVVRQIVNAHGGFIGIDSAIDAGTTVSIRFSLVG